MTDQTQARSIVKTRRSFSSQEPPSYQTNPSQNQFRKHQLDTLAELPSSQAQSNPKPKFFQKLVQQKMTAGLLSEQKQQHLQQHHLSDIQDTATLNSIESERFVASSGGAAPCPGQQASSGEKRRSFSVIETFGPGGTKTTTTDSNMNEYLKHTSQWRSMRGQLNLPSEVRMKLEMRKAFSFKNVALGVLHDVESKHSRYHHHQKRARVEPTYQLGPKQHCKQIEMEKIIRDILSAFISNLDSKKPENVLASVRGSIEHIITLIKARVKYILDPRYKIVVHSMIVDRSYQGVTVATKCLWDENNDSGVTVREDFKNISIIINLFAVYHE